MKENATARALRIIRDNEIHYPREFAWLMWPNDPGWERVSNVGRGATRGVGMWRAAGGFLGQLRKRGLITKWYRRESGQDFHLTVRGTEYLGDHSV